MKKLVATLSMLLFTVGTGAAAGSAMPNPLSSEQWAYANTIESEAERQAYIQKCIDTNPWMIEWRKNSEAFEN